ncbi:hypothetical protein [Ideonella paludis]|uniref:hypothetical protein n=1 Tax=Ideonella paludis TaxID=1233411 RepID=UPI0036261C83
MKRFTLPPAGSGGHSGGMPHKHPTPKPPAHAAAHAFKGLADWIEVFKAGAHTDSKGTECAFSTADLDQMVANVALGKPPP